MFKKHPQPKPSSNIKSSERRALLTTLCKEYGINREELPKDIEINLLPATIKQANYQSIQGHKGTIYFDSDEVPRYFKTRDSPVYPSIYTLWKVGGILPTILTNDHVIEKLSSNANLMLPGCIPPFDSRATRGALVGIASYRTPTVVKAIGHCSLNLTQFDSVVGRQGTAVTIIHVIEDELCKLAENEIECPTSVEPYSPTAFNSLNATIRALYGKDEEDDAENDDEVEEEEVGNEGIEDLKEDTETKSGDNVIVESSAQSETDNDLVDELSEAVEEVLVEDIDNFFIRAFIQLVKLNPKLELPISSSQFMGQYILKNLPKMDSKYCNIKKTSWKKSAKFLKSLEKTNYLTLKGKGDDVSIVSITVPQETIANFVTHKTNELNKANASSASKGSPNGLSVISLYKPTNKSRMLYNKIDKDYQKLHTQAELKQFINDYITVANLVDKKSPKYVNLDEHLRSATSIKEEKITRDKLVPAFTANHSPHFAVLKPGETTISPKMIHKGTPPKIKILTLTVLGRKKVTTVVGFEVYNIKSSVLAEDLKNKCSGSTSVGPCVHNPNLTEVMVQGPHGSTIMDYLKSRGVPSSYIEFEDKSKGRKKR